VIREAAPTLLDARRGNVQAFNVLVEACQDEAYSLAFRLLGDERAAVQAIQRAVEQSHRSLATCRGEFRLWFFRHIVQVCKYFSASSSPKPTILTDQANIQSMLNSLPLDLRLSAVLVDVLGLSYDQAAEVAEINSKKIRQTLALARYSLIA
jgi:DNA-directed RNA polymerase specialized sigma24 family protein